MTATVILRQGEKPGNHPVDARRAARRAAFEGEGLIVDSLDRGVSVAEVARRIGVTEKRMRAVVRVHGMARVLDRRRSFAAPPPARRTPQGALQSPSEDGRPSGRPAERAEAGSATRPDRSTRPDKVVVRRRSPGK